MEILVSGNIEQLEELAVIFDDFPNGKDNFISRHWITNAIDCASLETIKWMLAKGVSLDFRDNEGYTPLLSAIERDRPQRYQIMKLLFDYRVPLNKQGINDWTPLHLAAARDDVEACKLLIEQGASTSIRTRIDDYATPLEEARMLGCKNAAKYLESIV
ncbi:MAG: ankyrin repeat domain-containing protein [Prochloraceae cyanobacterium]